MHFLWVRVESFIPVILYCPWRSKHSSAWSLLRVVIVDLLPSLLGPKFLIVTSIIPLFNQVVRKNIFTSQWPISHHWLVWRFQWYSVILTASSLIDRRNIYSWTSSFPHLPRQYQSSSILRYKIHRIEEFDSPIISIHSSIRVIWYSSSTVSLFIFLYTPQKRNLTEHNRHK